MFTIFVRLLSFRIIQKLKSISDKQNVILKRLSYLSHVKLLYYPGLFRLTLGLSWDNLELRTYPRDKYDDKCEVRDYPGMILNEKKRLHFLDSLRDKHELQDDRVGLSKKWSHPLAKTVLCNLANSVCENDCLVQRGDCSQKHGSLAPNTVTLSACSFASESWWNINKFACYQSWSFLFTTFTLRYLILTTCSCLLVLLWSVMRHIWEQLLLVSNK